jgi:hypothetical protein
MCSASVFWLVNMFTDLQHRVAELRFIDGIEKVEHVQFSTGDQFWVRFNRPLDIGKLEDIVKKRGCRLTGFGGLPSKLPRKLSEVLWDGVTHVIVRNTSGWGRLTSSLGFEPDGIGKIVLDLHGPYQIFIAMNEDCVQILYDYLGVKYVPSAPPIKPGIPAAQPAVTVRPPVVVAAAPNSASPQAPSPSASASSQRTPSSAQDKEAAGA